MREHTGAGAPDTDDQLLVELCANSHSPLATEAYLASLAIEHGCELVTTDRYLARFKRWRWHRQLRA